MILLIVSLAYTVFLLAYEGWAIATGHKTITEHVRDVQGVWPVFLPLASFIFGGLLVHFAKWF